MTQRHSDTIQWLNDNATHIASGWSVWQIGGGCTAYGARGEYQGQRAQFLLSHDMVAEPSFVQSGDPWLLCAYVQNDKGEVTHIANLSMDQTDMRNAIAHVDLLAELEGF